MELTQKIQVLKRENCSAMDIKRSKIWASIARKPSSELFPYKAVLLDCDSGYSRLLGQGGGLVRGLPGKLRLGAAKVTVCRRLLVDRPAQVQAFNLSLIHI